MTKESVEVKYNRTTRFLLPSLRLNEEALLKMGLVNCYLTDNEYDVRWDLEGCLYLLFKPEKLDTEFEEYCDLMRQLPCYKDEYDVENGVVFVCQIPTIYQGIVKPFKQGKYSAIDKNYVKQCVPQFINGKLSKRWKIFYKDKSIIEELAKELGYKTEEEANKWIIEVEDVPYAEDEIFRYNPEIETDLERKT